MYIYNNPYLVVVTYIEQSVPVTDQHFLPRSIRTRYSSCFHLRISCNQTSFCNPNSFVEILKENEGKDITV